MPIPHPRLLIVWHSRTGGSRQMAQASARGARRQGGVNVRMRSAARAGPQDLLDADGVLLVAPENLASLSGPMKDFLDRIYYPLLEQRPSLPYAALICAGSDGSGAVRQLQRIAQGLRWRAIAEPLIVCTQAQSAEAILAPKTIAEAELQRCAEIGATLAAGLGLGIF